MQTDFNAQYQQLIQQAQHAQTKTEILGYTLYAAVILCAIFSALCFWKLCQIKDALSTSPRFPAPDRSPFEIAASQPAPAAKPNPFDDSRYMPKR